MNDAVNTVESCRSALASSNSGLILMKPGDTWDIGSPWDNKPAIEFWRQKFEETPGLEYENNSRVITIPFLQQSYEDYRTRIAQKNSLWLIRLLSFLPGLQVFAPFRILVIDLNRVCRFSFWGGMEEVPGTNHDVAMTSDNLDFVFKHEFGYDTLLVNGRFLADNRGFAAMTKNFSIGSLNAMGITVSLRSVFDVGMLWMLGRRMTRFLKKVAQARNVQAAASTGSAD